MSIGDLLMGVGGTQNQISQALRGPQPLGGPSAPPGGPPAAPGGSGPPPGPAAAPGPSASPSVAPQSPPDLMNLYQQLYQREYAAQSLDRHLGLMAAALSAPGTANNVWNSMPPPQDPGQQLGTMMQLAQMQRMANMPAPAGLDANTAAIWPMLPPDAKMKYLEALGTSSIAIAQKGAETKQADLLEAQQKAPGALAQMSDMETTANQLKGPMSPALQSIISSPIKRAAAMKLLETDPKEAPGAIMTQVAAAGLSSDEQAALQQLKKLDAQIYGDAFQSTGSRRTQQEVANLKNGISSLKNFNQSPDAYMSQFNDFQNQLHKTIVNTYGAAGRLDEIPDNMKWDVSNPKAPKPLVDSAYLPGGDKYGGQGGQWANQPPAAISDNAGYNQLPSGAIFVGPDGQLRKKP